MLKDKHIILGVTGGIAAYKTPNLIRTFRKNGFHVRVVISEAAREFVSPVTLSTLSGNEVLVGTFPHGSSGTIHTSTWHIDLAQWADIMLIAPATANTIAKLAHGYADNTVTTVALALRCPLLIAPSMDTDMFQHPTTERNLNKLQEFGYLVLPPEIGELASGLTGTGRLPELDVLVKTVESFLNKSKYDLKDKKVLVTAGPTLEAIDPIRFIGNRSSGKMGFALANAAALRGAEVTLITGPVNLYTPRNVERIDVESTEQMFKAVMKYSKDSDATIMAAAVADFTPKYVLNRKIKKEQLKGDNLLIEFKKTKDILQHLSQQKAHGVLVGFSLETNNEIKNAKKKIIEKKLDFIVLNNPLKNGAGFGSDSNIVTIISKKGKVEALKKISKFDVANEILNRIVKILV